MTHKDKRQPYLELLGKINTLDTQVSRLKDQLIHLKALIAGVVEGDASSEENQTYSFIGSENSREGEEK